MIQQLQNRRWIYGIITDELIVRGLRWYRDWRLQSEVGQVVSTPKKTHPYGYKAWVMTFKSAVLNPSQCASIVPNGELIRNSYDGCSGLKWQKSIHCRSLGNWCWYDGAMELKILTQVHSISGTDASGRSTSMCGHDDWPGTSMSRCSQHWPGWGIAIELWRKG